jgi:hypothetical protein
VSSPVCECLLGTLGALYWQPSGRLVERLSGKPVELGQLHIGSRVPGSLGGASVSHQDGACPSRVGLQLFHMDLEPGRASWVGWILVMAGAQQGLKGSGLGEGAGMPASCGTGSRLGSGADCGGIWVVMGQWHGQGADIPAWCGQRG